MSSAGWRCRASWRIASFLFTHETLEGARHTAKSTPFASVTSMALDLEDAQRRYHFAFNDEDRVRVPFYGALLTALEHDEQAQILLAEIRVEQRNAMLIL